MLNGKTALVTGSSQGIGFAVARAMAASGATVVLTSEVPPAAVHDLPKNAHYIQADLSRDGELERLMTEARAAIGPLDILVNNLGTYREPPLLDLTRDHFDFLFRLNVWVAIALTREMVCHAHGRGGRILFSSSLNGSRSEPLHTLYDASKGAINALTRQLAVELAPLGFTTAAIAPGLVETPLTDFGLQSDPSGRRAILEQIPLRRIATVDDLAAWYVFLASDASRYSTGSIFTVDGGLDAQQMAVRPITDAERKPL